MTTEIMPKNTIFLKATLPDYLNYHKNDVALDINCHAVGTIQTFNPAKQTATASINYQKVIYMEQPGGAWGPVLVAYPVLVDCPVKYPFGAKGGVTHPYAQGDEVWIEFNDRDFDAWFAGQMNQAPFSARLHSFTDAIISGSVKSSENVIEDFDADRPALRNFEGTSGVAVGSTKVRLFGNGTTLNALLQQLITDIQNITVVVASAPGTSGPPLNAAALAADANAIGALLE